MLENEPNAPAEPVAKVEPASVEANPNANAPPEVKAATPEPKAESETESSEPKTETEGSEDQEKPKNRASQRISELYAQKKQSEAEARAAWTEVARLKSELQSLAQKKADPNLSFEEQDALRVREAVKAERFEDAVAAARFKEEQATVTMQATFRAKVEAALDRLPDFSEVVTADRVPLTREAAEFIASSEKAADIAYHLGKNPQEAARIYSLPTWQQGAELARIEARVGPPPAVRKISQAPKPVSTLAGGSSPVIKDPATMSQKEYEAWRAKKQG